MQSLEAFLQSAPWTRYLSQEEFERVATQIVEHRPLASRQFIYRQGDPARHWIGVIEGFVAMSVISVDGKSSILTGVPPGGWFGEGTLLRRERWRYNTVAIKATRIACMPIHLFEELLSGNAGFNRYMLTHLNARLSLFISLTEFDRLLGPQARVARCLASLFDPDLYPDRGDYIGLSQEEIGLLSGVSRQRAHSAIHALQAEGLLRVERGGVRVLELSRLASLAD